jgi:hypothetical protein
MSPRDGKSCKVASLHMARHVAVSRAAVSRIFAKPRSSTNNFYSGGGGRAGTAWRRKPRRNVRAVVLSLCEPIDTLRTR